MQAIFRMGGTFAIKKPDGTYSCGGPERLRAMDFLLTNLGDLHVSCYLITEAQYETVGQCLLRWGLARHFVGRTGTLRILRMQHSGEGETVKENLEKHGLTAASALYVDDCAESCQRVTQMIPGIQIHGGTLTEKDCREIIGSAEKSIAHGDGENTLSTMDSMSASEAAIHDRSQSTPYKDHIVHVWRVSDSAVQCCEGGSGHSMGSEKILDVSSYTSVEWACFPAVMIHGGRTLPVLMADNTLQKLRDAHVPVALAKLKPDSTWDPEHRKQMGGKEGWAVNVYSDVGTSKADFMANPRDYVLKHDCGPATIDLTI